MAHIADFMVDTKSSVGLNNYIARELSPHSFQDATTETSASTDEKEKYVWRMHQPTESRKYQLFPAKEKLSIAAGRKSPDPETVFQVAMGQTGTTGEKDRSILGSALRLKPKEQTLIRRRKVSVPELGPMTTVQEIAMDSPTIPGRPPLHERSISAPGNSWRQHVFGESMLSCISGPALDENAEMAISESGVTTTAGVPESELSQSTTTTTTSTATLKPASSSPKQPLSPKSLAPLVIPSTSTATPRLNGQTSNARLRSGSNPPDVPPKSARMKEGSPHARASPFTPMSASTTTTAGASTVPTSVSNTPNSAPEGRSSPKPWNTPIAPTSAGPSPMGHTRGQSEAIQQRIGHLLGHRRGESEASIMDRGRPKKRADGSPIKRSLSKRSPSMSEEQKAFETLPQGVRATEATTLLPANEIDVLRKQAIGQASRFEVLSSKDVDVLSRELRGLDERCEYLRKTHRSLRSGRRNLHDRICTYLRSPRVARFSHESMLKQEEALSELDSSIDDWVSKLEQAENRRTRVRQKLLEHVAGALIMQPSAGGAALAGYAGAEVEGEDGSGSLGMGGLVRQVVMGGGGENTPPRSPTKSASPTRLADPVKVFAASPEPMSRREVESIRIYADSDVYALLADVEEEINRMGQADASSEMGKLDQQAGEKDVSNAMAAGITLNAVAFSGTVKAGYV